MKPLRPAEFAAAGFAPGIKRRLFLISLGLVLFLYPFGFVFITAGALPERFSWTGSFVISLYGATTYLSELRRVPAGLAAFSALALAGALFGAEYAGVSTGYPFGAYRYTDALGFRLAGVPLAISVAWYATVVSSWRIASAVLGPASPALPVALLAGFLTVLLDVALEPMASGLARYWLWEGGIIPLQNYLSWFVFTVAVVLLLSRSDRGRGATGPGLLRTALLVYGLQLFFFSVTDLLHGRIAPVGVSCVGVAAVAALHMFRTRRQEALQA